MSDFMTAPTWAQCKLEDVCRLVNGRAYKRPELLDSGKYRVLRVGNLFTNGSWFWSDLELDQDKYIDNGDLIYAWSASFGPRIWHGEKVIYHYHIWKCLPNPDVIDKHFLYRLFEWDTAKIKADHGTGSTMIHVTKGAMEARPIGLPPLPEQRRIVAKLDRLSARSAAARDHLARTTKLATRAKQAILRSVFGEWNLCDTENTRCADGKWKLVPLSDLIDEGPTNGWSPKADGDADCGTPTLKLSATTQGFMRLSDDCIKYLALRPDEDSKYWLLPGDLLVQRANSLRYLGASPIYNGPPKTYIYPDLMMRLRINSSDLRQYIWRYLNSPIARDYFMASATGTAGNMPKISGKILKSLMVPLPTKKKELPEIVRRIETAFARIDRLTEEASRAAHLLDRLDERLLAKAFAGKLVPQNPEDEPAETLLTRIREARAAAPKLKRGRKKKAAAE